MSGTRRVSVNNLNFVKTSKTQFYSFFSFVDCNLPVSFPGLPGVQCYRKLVHLGAKEMRIKWGMSSQRMGQGQTRRTYYNIAVQTGRNHPHFCQPSYHFRSM